MPWTGLGAYLQVGATISSFPGFELQLHFFKLTRLQNQRRTFEFKLPTGFSLKIQTDFKRRAAPVPQHQVIAFVFAYGNVAKIDIIAIENFYMGWTLLGRTF